MLTSWETNKRRKVPRANLAQKANSFSKSNKLESKRSVSVNKLSQI